MSPDLDIVRKKDKGKRKEEEKEKRRRRGTINLKCGHEFGAGRERNACEMSVGDCLFCQRAALRVNVSRVRV